MTQMAEPAAGVSPADDHFLAFLDRLAEDLDRAPAGGEALARDAHLSRFHFDRVIKAVAGESPTRLRQRLLLERAAYRMITTRQTLLDVAVEAGFGSHEAFTRAFSREYGAAPSRWRERPTRFQIEAPSDVHFHPPGGLRLPSRHRMDDVGVLMEMVEHHVWLVERLVDRAERLDDDDLDAPLSTAVEATDGETLRWLLSRLIGQMAMWNAAVEDRDYDFALERDESVTSMRQRLASTAPDFLGHVRRCAEDGRFDETFVDAHCETPRVLSYAAMVSHVLTFAAHHRLLAVTRMGECGIDDLGLGDPKDWYDLRR